MATGTVESYWGRGIGFITPDGGGDGLVFEMSDRYTFKPGKKVTFDFGEDEMLKWALNVRVLSATGRVKWYSDEKNYGFVSQDGGHDVFVHCTEIHALRPLRPGERVMFDVVQTERGLQAERLCVLP